MRSEADLATLKPVTAADRRRVLAFVFASIGERIADAGFGADNPAERIVGGRRIATRLQTWTAADADVTFEIFYKPDPRDQMRGWLHYAAGSAALARWREARQPYRRPMATIVAGQVGDLKPAPEWMTLTFGDPARRERDIDRAVDAIHTGAYPLIAMLKDPASNLGHLLDGSPFHARWLLEYAFAVLGQNAAKAAGTALLERNGRLRDDYVAARERLALVGPAQDGSGSAGTALATFSWWTGVDLWPAAESA